MEPPSPSKPDARPKRSCETAESVAATPGRAAGRPSPGPPASRSMVMCAPSSVLMAEIKRVGRRLGVHVGR